MQTMTDRTKFVLNTSAEYFNVSCATEELSVREFFDNDDLTILAATLQYGKIFFHQRVPTDENCLLFYKIPRIGNRQSSDSSTLGILTLEGGMVKSMYNSMSRVFSPNALMKNEYNSELCSILENLNTSLGTTLGLPQTGISCIQDEINYWSQKSINAQTKADKEQSDTFAIFLEKINKHIKEIDHSSLTSIEEFLDSAHNNLDEIWRLPYHYPQNRMADLMDVICSQIIETCIENLMIEDVWNLNSYHVNNLMNQVLDITESWINLCDSLTRLFWPNYGQHPWIGKPHAPMRGQSFKERLADIKNIKNLYKQIVSLLEDQDLRDMFSWSSPFKAINIFDTSPVGQKKWNKALNQFEQLLQPIDERIAIAIKSQLGYNLNNPRQVIFIFSKYDTLIQRPTVLDLLTTEREQFLHSLELLLQDLKVALSNTNIEPDAGYLSPICNECRWIKIVQHQIDEIEKVSHLVNGREGFGKINEVLQELKEETSTLLKTNFEIWSEQSLSAVKSGELRLREDQSVVQFQSDGRQLMFVNYNPKLVSFCQDVREFENLGFRIPIELRFSATHAAKFMSHARSLQQIATFHNTIGDRMIPCQRPIMLKNAIELSRLVHSKSVVWSDEASVKEYVLDLQKAVQRLSNDNNILVGYHEQIKRKIVKLMNTDLLTQSQIWKDEMRHLRDIITTLEKLGYDNLEAFKLHWDHQLYKVLEYQYILGLIDMNNKLPEIHIDILFRQKKLQFRPSEEEIRDQYYKQLRNFIERPLKFRGLSDRSNDLFKVMVDRNRHHFATLFKRAHELFQKLEELKTLWVPLVSLGCVDIEELCAIHLVKWEHWDKNFKACKRFSQQIAKIQDSEEPLDCFVINILPLRTDIENISRSYWNALTNSLRASILNDVSDVQHFVQSSLQFLQNISVEADEIAESGIKYEYIRNELPRVSAILESVQKKDTCLAGWCKERVSSLSGLIVQWEKLQPLIENHSAVLQRQVDIIRDHMGVQIVNLKDEAEKFSIRWESMIAELEADNKTSLELFRERQQSWKMINETKDKLFEDAAKFNIQLPQDVIEIFSKIEAQVNLQGQQWELYEQFLNDIDVVAVEEWSVYRRRPYLFTEVLSKWETSSNSSIDQAASRIRQAIEKYQEILPVLQYLQSDALTERNWAKIFQLLKKDPKSFHTICLKDVISDPDSLIQNAGQIQVLVRQASSEQIVRQALNELEQWGVTAVLKLTTHTDSSNNIVPLIKDFNEVLNKIGDNQSLLQSAKNSAAFEAFSDQAEIWESRLNMLDTILTSLSQSQRRWVYLEPVFGAGTLKNEEALFKRIDKDFRYIMREIENDPRVVTVGKISNISVIIKSLESQLSRCQSTLMSFITNKRNTFPRFYFLGDDDLLELLGQATKENIIQKHIKKLFVGIHTLGIEDSNLITKIKSSEGDSVQLLIPVKITGSIEVWLNELVISIQKTLKDQISKCAQIQEFSKANVSQYCMQVLCTARAINFTKQVEKAITTMSLSSVLNLLKKELTKFTDLKNNSDSSLDRIKLKGLLLDLVHYMTVIEYLIEKNITSLEDWHWIQQMKFHFNRDGVAIIRMGYAEFEYSYEYLGNPSKLVHTRLTHKCYLTLTQSMQLGMGGNPFGPAGTGKTECVKALGAMLGRLVLVFNCDENVDTEAMGLILMGLARCGAWGCFDEFNRLQEATLSAISMLIQPIQSALKEKAKTVNILNNEINLNLHCGIFVTLNPAGEEYGGRQQLPGNIQALFRPIVMEQPNKREIAKVMLFVDGFKEAEKIGDRLVELFSLAPKILSAQKHYDWGLRELKTVLLACGSIFREKNSNFDEMTIVAQALRSSTMSKLTASDRTRFEMLLSNVFPDITTDAKTNTALEESLKGAFVSLGLVENLKQIEKCLQLYEQLTKRMGVMIVGPPCSGKSTILSILKQALISSGKTIRSYTMNPKSMTRVQLLGKLDPDTRQWTDGVLTTTAVAVNAESIEVCSWIICDGDVDPEWIEALNSVLDDNKLLTLPSGWRIQFDDNVHFLFETHDLTHASPATISRMGIINISYEDLDIKVITESLLTKHEDPEFMSTFIENYVKKCVEWIDKEFRNDMQLPNMCMFKSALKRIENSQTKGELCVYLARGLLGYISHSEHNKFVNKLYDLANVYIPDPTKAEFSYYNSFRDAIETYVTDTTSTAGSENSENNLVRTGQIKAYLESLRDFLKSSEYLPFIIIGPPGSAKTLMLHTAIGEFSGCQLVVVNCSAQLTPSYILYSLKQNCITVSGVRGREYKPRQQRIVLFLKNIDLCLVDSWGTSSVVELLLQLIGRNGFYSENLEWISVSGLQVCASMDDMPKQKLSPRYLALNSFLRVQYPSEADMPIIVENQLQPLLLNFNQTTNKTFLVNRLIILFNEVRDSFTQFKYAHYNFSPKMITSLLDGLRHYPADHFNQALVEEINTIFRNRLCTEEDVREFDGIFKNNIKNLMENANKNDFFVPKGPQSTMVSIISNEEWLEIVQKNIAICNTEYYNIEQPITEELLKQTACLVRLLVRPGTHIVLVGRMGSRRTDSLYIAATILTAKIQLPQGVRNYNMIDFYNDLKMAMQSAALDNQIIIFMIDHLWLTFLGDIIKPIEAILKGSEIVDLFGEDLESIASPLKGEAQLEGYQESLASYFMKRVKNNLRIVLSLEATSGSLPELFSVYPALYKNTSLIWIQKMSEKTMNALPKQIISTHPQEKEITIPVYFSQAISYSPLDYTPRQYENLIVSYYHIFMSFLKKTKDRSEKLKIGVDKLRSTHEIVDTLKTNAAVQEKALGEKRKLANEALEMISATMRNANDQKSDLLELKKKTQENSEKLMERKKAIEIELMEVEPVLKEALAAVGQIKTEALSEIRSLRAPPETIRDILEGVLRLMGIRDTSWNSMKSFLAKRGIKEDIKSLDPARINPENRESVERLLVSKADSFDMRNAKRASAAAAPLASWVIASVKYSKVIQSIKPLEMEQNQLQKNLEIAEGQVKALMSGLNDVDARVKELSGQLNMHTQEAAVLELKLEDARNTLRAAEVLVEKLSSEYKNWTKQLGEYEKTYKTLDTKSFVIALAINLYSGLIYENRINILNMITMKIQQPNFNITKSLITEQDQIIWESMGLPGDVQSIENSALLGKIIELPYGTCPIPLIIDPLENALTWLREYLRASQHQFEIVSQKSDKLVNSLELAVRFGKVFVVQNCEKIEPPILQLTTQRFFSKFNKKSLQVGNKMIDVHEHFRIILITKLNTLKLEPELGSNLTMIPYTITTTGLSDQLMSKAISLKRPELEEKRINLLKNEGDLLKQRIELQSKLLEELSSAKGDILKNEQLLKTLNEVKESTKSIDESLTKSGEIKRVLMEEYGQYKEFCDRASILYMGILELYAMSVATFKNLFIKSLKNDHSLNESQRYSYLVRITYQYLCRSTPKSGHLTLGMFICKNAFPDNISDMEWELFVTNFMLNDETGTQTYPTWLKSEQIPKVVALKTHVPEVYAKLNLENKQIWRAYAEGDDKSVIPIPVTVFQKVMLAQIFRPDTMTTAMDAVVYEMIGIKPGSFMQPSIDQLVEETSNLEPIILITKSANEPTVLLKEAARKKLGKETFVEISIGGGMEKHYLKIVREAAERGKWVCIKNVHLAAKWLLDLERELELSKPLESFRIWLIAESVSQFPETFLTKCLKVLFESPQGIKNKMNNLMQQWSPIISNLKDAKLIKLHVILFILNSVLQERRNYIPQGWSTWYDFGDSDLRTASEFIMWLDKNIRSSKVDWLILQGLCENIAYGGRINNTQDLAILLKYLDEFFNEQTLTGRWNPPGWKITIPTCQKFQDYFDIVQKLPDIDSPQDFGLSPSSNLSRNITICRNVLKTLRNAYFHNEEQGSLEKRIRPILSLWKKLTASSTVAKTFTEMQEDVNAGPWKTFLNLEMKIAGQLFKEIHKTLVQLHILVREQKSIMKGEDLLIQAIADNLVPITWRKIWTGPKSAVDYIKSVVAKGIETELRYKETQQQNFIDELDLASTFNPQTFISALKLVTAEDLNVSACGLVLQSKSSKLFGRHVIKISSLLIDGAYFNGGKLTVFDYNKSIVTNKSPEFYLTFVEKENFKPETYGLVEMPLYTNNTRDTRMCTLFIESNDSKNIILLSGAAFIVPDLPNVVT